MTGYVQARQRVGDKRHDVLLSSVRDEIGQRDQPQLHDGFMGAPV